MAARGNKPAWGTLQQAIDAFNAGTGNCSKEGNAHYWFVKVREADNEMIYACKDCGYEKPEIIQDTDQRLKRVLYG